MILSAQLAHAYGGALLALDPGAIGQAITSAAAPAVERSQSVAIVRVRGPLLHRATATMCGGRVDGYDGITSRFQAALDSDADSVLLDIDSPGGSVAGLFEAMRSMRAAKAASGKRVVAFANELAASAAFGIASVADEIVTPETGKVGSIGILAVHEDLSGAAEKVGAKYTIVRAPAGKAEGHPFEPLQAATRARWQSEISELAESFASLVGAGLGKTGAQLLALDGRTYRGAEAKAKGLAHRVGGADVALESALVASAKPRTYSASTLHVSWHATSPAREEPSAEVLAELKKVGATTDDWRAARAAEARRAGANSGAAYEAELDRELAARGLTRADYEAMKANEREQSR